MTKVEDFNCSALNAKGGIKVKKMSTFWQFTWDGNPSLALL